MNVKTEEEIIETLKRDYNLMVGELTACDLRARLQDCTDSHVPVKRRELRHGLKATIEVPVAAFYQAE
jgi:actin-like ATPase involved in cell morphogenesis